MINISQKIALASLVLSSIFAVITIIVTIFNNHKRKNEKNKIATLTQEIVNLNQKQVEVEDENAELQQKSLELSENQEKTKREIFEFIKKYLDSMKTMDEMQNRIDDSIKQLKVLSPKTEVSD